MSINHNGNGYPKGIFCLEGNWSDALDEQPPVEAMLRLLHRGAGIPFVHRDCTTFAELSHYLKKWERKPMQRRYPILYFGFHGTPGTLQIPGGNGEHGATTLDDLAELLAGKCRGSVIFFGSCNTLRTKRGELKRFLQVTEAAAICGYLKTVNWMHSAIFELSMFQALQENEFSRRGMPAIERRIKRYAERYRRELSFRIVY